jgi:hypothetical protein
VLCCGMWDEDRANSRQKSLPPPCEAEDTDVVIAICMGTFLGGRLSFSLARNWSIRRIAYSMRLHNVRQPKHDHRFPFPGLLHNGLDSRRVGHNRRRRRLASRNWHCRWDSRLHALHCLYYRLNNLYCHSHQPVQESHYPRSPAESYRCRSSFICCFILSAITAGAHEPLGKVQVLTTSIEAVGLRRISLRARILITLYFTRLLRSVQFVYYWLSSRRMGADDRSDDGDSASAQGRGDWGEVRMTDEAERWIGVMNLLEKILRLFPFADNPDEFIEVMGKFNPTSAILNIQVLGN